MAQTAVLGDSHPLRTAWFRPKTSAKQPQISPQTQLVIVVSLCLARRWYRLARCAGGFLASVPGIALLGWYMREWLACGQSADSAACFEYLNSSPLLPFGVAFLTIISLMAVGLVLFIIEREQQAFGCPVEPG